MGIGDNIKRRREARNLTQSDLAECLGVSDKTVSSWEINRTEPKMGMIEKISIALNCKKTDIIGADKSELDDCYYLNEETAQAAQEMYDDPDMRTLFDMKRNMPADRFAAHIKFMRDLYEKENPSD